MTAHHPSAAGPTTTPEHPLVEPVITWYDQHARDLPWRTPGTTPWQVLVSEVMLQQTPVSRVLPVWHEWVTRWPTAARLAAETPGEAIRAWGRLGYPRRAVRLHEAATAIVGRHEGQVPADRELLRALPGVGDYTASAVATFAFGQRHSVVDVNVRRVHARAVSGSPHPASTLTRAEAVLAQHLLPDDAARAGRWSIGVMELGALVCTARAPRCRRCPVVEQCGWQQAGAPVGERTSRTQTWHGTDRQVRGRLVHALRGADRRSRAELRAATEDVEQAQYDRCLHSLVVDRLVEPLPGEQFRLPHS